MKPKSISYSESKESVDAIGLKSWRKAGVEIELDDGERIAGAFDSAKSIVADALRNDVADGLAFDPKDLPYINSIPTTLPTIDYSSKERTEDAIRDAKTEEDMWKLSGDAAKHKLVKQFNEKMQLLKTT